MVIAENISLKVTQYDYVITPSTPIVDGTNLNLPAGAVVGIEAGTRGALLIRNFIGADGKPITIVNKGGKVVIRSSGSYGLKFENSRFIRVTGTGDDTSKYGIEIDGGHITMTMDKLTTDFEIDHLEVHNAGFAGIMAKTDPSCDTSTWRGNFTMRNVSIHDNFVHDVKGEGFYIGNSFYAGGRDLSCGNIKPHEIENVKIFNNITKNTGCEGIQLGCAVKGAEVFNNIVELFGQDPFSPAQDNGIQIGEGTGGKLYNNIVKNGPGNGLIILGLGDNVIFNNLVINAGSNGAFIDERYSPGSGFAFYNNTFINPKGNGVLFYSEQVPMNTFINNIIVNPGSGKYIGTKSGVRLTQSNNLLTMDIKEAKFVDPTSFNFALQPDSPAIGKGLNLAEKGITFDLNNNPRPQNAGFDIGAYQYSISVQPIPEPVEEPASPATTVAEISSFTLIDADSDKDIATITDGYTLDLSKITTRAFNIRANTASKVGSVVMNLNNQTRTESAVPYTFFGDSGADYKPGSLPAGNYTLSGTPYGSPGGAGTKGNTKTVKFTVVSATTAKPAPVEPTAPTGSPVTGFTLVNAGTEKDIMTIIQGAIIDRAALGTTDLNIRANVNGSAVGSLVLTLNSVKRTENTAPYTIFGDSNGNYNSGALSPGTYTMTAKPYSGSNGSGTALTPYSITFTVK